MPTRRAAPAADRRYEAESPEDFFSVAAFSAGLSAVFSEDERGESLRRLSAPVVSRVEARALEVHGDGEEEFSTGPAPQTGHAAGGRSVIFWKSSNVSPFGHRYS